MHALHLHLRLGCRLSLGGLDCCRHLTVLMRRRNRRRHRGGLRFLLLHWHLIGCTCLLRLRPRRLQRTPHIVVDQARLLQGGHSHLLGLRNGNRHRLLSLRFDGRHRSCLRLRRLRRLRLRSCHALLCRCLGGRQLIPQGRYLALHLDQSICRLFRLRLCCCLRRRVSILRCSKRRCVFAGCRRESRFA